MVSEFKVGWNPKYSLGGCISEGINRGPFLGNPAPLGSIPEGDGRGVDFPKKQYPFVLMDECQNVCRTWVSKWDNHKYSMDPVILMYWYRLRIPDGSSYIGLPYLELPRMPVQCA